MKLFSYKLLGGYFMGKIFIAVLIVTITMIVAFSVIEQTNAQNASAIGSSLVVDGNSISVSISGEITRSGTYLLDINTSLSDLISVASGTTSNADSLAYDTSYPLVDGLSFYIAPKYDNTDVCSLEPITKVNINNDTPTKLQTISGIGSAVASAIVSYRDANGDYKRIEDIKNVSGIGNATFEKIKNYIVLRNA
jgi:competence protein ComEA